MRRLSGPRWLPTVAIALLLAGCGVGPAGVGTPEPAVPTTAGSQVTVPPVTSPATDTSTAVTTTTPAVLGPISALTGLPAAEGPVLAVKIDNTAGGRPQFGLAAADLVYVEQVEAGLTRLVAVYHSELPDEVGPVRSVRTTDTELLEQFGVPGLVFSGGADGPLATLAGSPVVNLSQDRHPDLFWRSDAAKAPYNLHVDLAAMGELAEDAGVGPAPDTIGFRFQATDGRISAGEPVTEITVSMTSPVTFSYRNGRYLVLHDDEPYRDAGGDLVAADNVLVQDVTREADGTVDANGTPSYESHTVGEGTFTLFREGYAVTGTWERTAADGPTTFRDEDGVEMTLAPGRTWVLLAPENAWVTTG